MKVPHFLTDLELDRTADERAVRRAYARKLKEIDVERDPGAFQALRETYEAALMWAKAESTTSSAQAESPAPRRVEDSAAPSSSSASDHVESALLSDRQASEESATRGHSESRPYQPDEVAGEVFEEFVARLGSRFQDVAQVKRDLEQSLSDPRLINLEARELFEWRLVCWLANGWRPGNEALIGVAATRFDWERDRQRLCRFGHPGRVLDYAILQLTAFKQQDEGQREQQLEAIRRLRSSEPPSRRDLLTFLPWVEQAATHFPVLLPLITNTDNIPSWRELDRQIPTWRRKLSYRRSPRPAGDARRAKSGSSWSMAILFIIVIQALANLGRSDPSPPAPSYSSGSQQSFERLPKALPPAPPSAPLAESTVDALSRGRVDGPNCNHAARIAAAYRLGTQAPLAETGADFDRFILACVDRGLWPRSAYSDPMVKLAMERVQEKFANSQRHRSAVAP